MARRIVWLVAALTLTSQSAFAQMDIMGVWRPLPRNQDGSGMTGDVAGVPVSDAARWRVQSWSPEDFDVTEWACRPHAWDYSLEGPLSALRLWAEIDQATQKVIAYHGHLNMQEQESTIWMDGRPHPPANALHTWSGFSTGEWDGDTLVVSPSTDSRRSRERHGLSRTLVANMVEGVSQGFTRKLEIVGVGYRASVQGKKLVVSAGYSHPVEMIPPDGVSFAVENNTTVLVSGADKEVVGNEAAKVRAIRPPEPYKGKGIKYEGEKILRKVGKTGKK